MEIIHNKKNVTRKTIAQLTGTSVSVVSRALNNSGYVEKSKKEAIIKAAKDNNYFPHPVAMSLQQQKTKQILFFCKDLYNAFNIELYYGMLREAGKHDYMVLINADISFEKIKQTMVDFFKMNIKQQNTVRNTVKIIIFRLLVLRTDTGRMLRE